VVVQDSLVGRVFVYFHPRMDCTFSRVDLPLFIPLIINIGCTIVICVISIFRFNLMYMINHNLRNVR
jgi:hypothetical protein